MILEKIEEQIIIAMKASDEVRLGTFRMLKAELQNAKIDKKEDLNDDEVLVIVRKEASKRKDAITEYIKAKREDKVKIEEAELVILQEFLPKDLSDEELEKVIDKVISEIKKQDPSATLGTSMSKVMGVVMKEVAGRANGNRVTEIVREKLQ